MSNEKKYGRDLGLRVGQPFVPYSLFIGAFLPEAVTASTILTGTEKVCWAKLNYFAGKKGYCYPSIKTLAQSIGVSVRQISRVIKGLMDKGFIARKAPDPNQKGKYRTTSYYFLWHESFNDGALKTQEHMPDPRLEVKVEITLPGDVVHNRGGTDCTLSGSRGDTPLPGADDTLPSDTGVIPPTGMDGTQRGIFEKNNLEEGCKKTNRAAQDDRWADSSFFTPSKDIDTSSREPETAFQKEKSGLLERYDPIQRTIINAGLICLGATHENGDLPRNAALSELNYWNEFPPDQVVKGIRIYLRQEHYLQKKNEHYLRGIIRNQSDPYSRISRHPMDEDQESQPFNNMEAFYTCAEWLHDTTGGNHAECGS